MAMTREDFYRAIAAGASGVGGGMNAYDWAQDLKRKRLRDEYLIEENARRRQAQEIMNEQWRIAKTGYLRGQIGDVYSANADRFGGPMTDREQAAQRPRGSAVASARETGTGIPVLPLGPDELIGRNVPAGPEVPVMAPAPAPAPRLAPGASGVPAGQAETPPSRQPPALYSPFSSLLKQVEEREIPRPPERISDLELKVRRVATDDATSAYYNQLVDLHGPEAARSMVAAVIVEQEARERAAYAAARGKAAQDKYAETKDLIGREAKYGLDAGELRRKAVRDAGKYETDRITAGAAATTARSRLEEVRGERTVEKPSGEKVIVPTQKAREAGGLTRLPDGTIGPTIPQKRLELDQAKLNAIRENPQAASTEDLRKYHDSLNKTLERIAPYGTAIKGYEREFADISTDLERVRMILRSRMEPGIEMNAVDDVMNSP